MRLPFFDPGTDEVAAVATDLITRFGLRARRLRVWLRLPRKCVFAGTGRSMRWWSVR